MQKRITTWVGVILVGALVFAILNFGGNGTLSPPNSPTVTRNAK